MSTEKARSVPDGSAQAQLASGAEFGAYRIVRLLGRGGMGAAYEVERREDGRRLALKIIDHALDTPDNRKRFLREGQLAASINHPNTVYIFGSEEIDGVPSIAMELVEGGTLEQRVKDEGPLPIPEAIETILQVINGLEAAQSLGILHRDIKPTNCFIDRDGAVKVGDFGLSISQEARDTTSLTKAGVVLGTPAYCSPEQLLGEPLDVRSDIYSVGVTLYYLLTGALPHKAEGVVQLIATALERPPVPPRSLRKEIPKRLEAVVLKCLHKKRADRFATYQELRQALAPLRTAERQPAPLPRRFLAGVVDYLILSGLGSTISYQMIRTRLQLAESGAPVIRPQAMYLVLVATILLWVLPEGLWGASLGKFVAGIRVQRQDARPPGIPRALLRVLVLFLPTISLGWLFGRSLAPGYASRGVLVWLAVLVPYLWLVALFLSCRRSNGFAAVHDLLSGTRVVIPPRGQAGTRFAVLAAEAPGATSGARRVGPYAVLKELGKDPTPWLLGYDELLKRRVWIRRADAENPPVPLLRTRLGRPARLRWLGGRREEENAWDAYHALGGRALLDLTARRGRPWEEVREWLRELAEELEAAARDSSAPEVLDLDRVWITERKTAVLLDFPAPGTAPSGSEIAADESPLSLRASRFLAHVARRGLLGPEAPRMPPDGPPQLPLPTHARKFLAEILQTPSLETLRSDVAAQTRRSARVTASQRAILLGACLTPTVVFGLFIVFAMPRMMALTQDDPVLGPLNSSLRWLRRGESRFRNNQMSPSEVAAYPAAELTAAAIYGKLKADSLNPSSLFKLGMVLERPLAERLLREHPEVSQAEVDSVAAFLGPVQVATVANAKERAGMMKQMWWFVLLMYGIFTAVMSLLGFLFFRGGIAVHALGIDFVTADGARASRARLVLRGLIAWGALLIAPFLLPDFKLVVAALFVVFLYGAVRSLWTPSRTWADHLARTWMVPR